MKYSNKLNRSSLQIISYSLLAFPLAFVGLPIYLNISDFYAKQFSLSLTFIGIALIFIRIIDILQDIFFGYLSDLAVKKNICRKKIIYNSIIFLAITFYLLFNPPILSKFSAQIWFIIILTLTYSFFNLVIINYEAIVAIIAKDKDQRIAINSTKEFFGLLGFLIAALLPYIFASDPEKTFQDGYFNLSLFFVISVLLITFIFFRKVKFVEDHEFDQKSYNFFITFKDKKYLFFLIIYLLNSIAVSFPSANIIFYVEDVLQKKGQFGIFLGCYFLSAICSIYIWKVLIQKFGKLKIWILSILGSVITFFFAFTLNADLANYFFLVCFLSGIFLGPDLVNPPSIVADLCHEKKDNLASYYGLYNMTSKIGLMIAASSSLIILGYFNYNPGSDNVEGVNAIPYVYALIPCILKIIVIILISIFAKSKNYEHSYYLLRQKGSA